MRREPDRGQSESSLPATPLAIVPGNQKWWILSSVSVGTFMSTLDGSIVNIALPTIQQDLVVGLNTVEWVVVAYLLIRGSLLLPFGRLGEMIGFKRVYLLGFLLFAGASGMSGVAVNVWMLVGTRSLQAIGGAMLSSMGPAIVTRAFGYQERGTALGLNSMSVAVGLGMGPTLGGVLTQFGSWRWIFFLNVPIGIFATIWGWRILPDEAVPGEQSFDLLGAVLSFTALFSLLLAIIQGQIWGWASLPILGLIALFAVLGTWFILVQLRRREPMLDLQLFRIRGFAAGNASLFASFVASYIAAFLLPFFLEEGQDFSPLKSGLLLTAIPVATLVVAPLSGMLADRIGEGIPATAGLAVMAAGLYLLTRLPLGAGNVDVIWRMAVFGLGQGIFNSPNSSVILGSAPRERLGTASGTLAQMRGDGQVLGIALGGAIVAHQLPGHTIQLLGVRVETVLERVDFAMAIHDALFVAALICLVAMIASAIAGSYHLGGGKPAATTSRLAGSDTGGRADHPSAARPTGTAEHPGAG